MDSLTKVGCGPPAFWGLCGGLTPRSRQKTSVTKPTQREIRSDPKYDDKRHGLMDLRLASWNVRSLYRPGAIYELTRELKRYHIGIAALQEVRWPGKGECQLDNGEVLFYSGTSNGHYTNGTGFIVQKRFLNNILRFDAISDRISVLRIKGKFANYTIVNVYAPTNTTEDQAKDDFYEELEAVYDVIPEYDIKIVIGDFNAKVGREPIFLPTIGTQSKHTESNDYGVRLISFAAPKSLVIKSTMFTHRDIYKGTWKSADGFTINQIDHVLIDNRHKTTIEDVRAFRGADCGTDHYMLIVKLRAKIKTSINKSYPREDIIDTENLKDKAIHQRYQVELNNSFKELEIVEDIDDTWNSIRDKIKEIGLQVLGKKRQKKATNWLTDECKAAIEEKKRVKILAEQDETFKGKFNELQNKTKNLLGSAKRKHMDNLVENMEKLIKSNETRKFYKEVRSIKKGYQPNIQFLEDANGNLITDPKKVKETWRDYFRNLLNCSLPPQQIQETGDMNEEIVDPPTFEEVRNAIMSLKNNKSSGIDNIPAELWKYGGGAAQSKLYELIVKIWNEEKVPTQWNTGIICPIHKKGSRKKCSN